MTPSTLICPTRVLPRGTTMTSTMNTPLRPPTNQPCPSWGCAIREAGYDWNSITFDGIQNVRIDSSTTTGGRVHAPPVLALTPLT